MKVIFFRVILKKILSICKWKFSLTSGYFSIHLYISVPGKFPSRHVSGLQILNNILIKYAINYFLNLTFKSQVKVLWRNVSTPISTLQENVA